MKALLAIAGLLTSASIGQASAAEIGDVNAGLAFARQVCAECHGVEPNVRKSPNEAAPSFADVADTTAMSALALKAWLQTSHPTMPNLILTNKQKVDVIAYILSLRQQHQ